MHLKVDARKLLREIAARGKGEVAIAIRHIDGKRAGFDAPLRRLKLYFINAAVSDIVKLAGQLSFDGRRVDWNFRA